jgi:hypothetical protein
LRDDGFNLGFPDRPVHNKEEFVDWYENYLNNYTSILHDIENIAVVKNANGSFTANVTIHTTLQPISGDTIDSMFLVTLGIASSNNNNYLVDYLGVRML